MLVQVEVRPGLIQQCLVPFVSLLNHDALNPHVREFGRLEDKKMQIRANRSCCKGEQIFLSYGHLPNWHLLLFYGFAVKENPNDDYLVQFQVSF